MPHQLLVASFDGNLSNLNNTLSRFIEYALGMVSKKTNINFCYIGTASGDSAVESSFFTSFIYFRFGKYLNINKLNLTANYSEQQLEAHIRAQDIVFIGGGNTLAMLEIWQQKGFINVLNRLRSEDKLPITLGLSSGGIWPFKFLSDSIPGQYNGITGLGWFNDISLCPHADSNVVAICPFDNNAALNRLQAYQRAIVLKLIPAGYAIPNTCLIHFSNGVLVCALTATENLNCRYVSETGAQNIPTHLVTGDNVSTIINETLQKLNLSAVPREEEIHASCGLM